MCLHSNSIVSNGLSCGMTKSNVNNSHLYNYIMSININNYTDDKNNNNDNNNDNV